VHLRCMHELEKRVKERKRERKHPRKSSETVLKKMEKAFQISPIAAACDSVIDPSCTRGTILAMNSTRAGIKSRTHCRRVGLPVDAEATSVFAQWAAVNDVWRIMVSKSQSTSGVG
jgi:hypothetical protein